MTRRAGCALLALALASPSFAAGRSAVRVRDASATRPDRELFQKAQRAERNFKANMRLQARRSEWEMVLTKYKAIVARYPQSPYCDNALLAVGDLYRSMAQRFKGDRYLDLASDAYARLVEEYPSSSLAEQALYSQIEIARTQREPRRTTEAARAYLAAFPNASRATQVKALLRARAPAQAAALPKPPPPGLAQVYKLRFWSGEASTRVVLDLEREVKVHHDRLRDPERLWVDLPRTRLHPSLTDRAFPVGDGLLEQVRIAQNRDDVVRVVLDFKSVGSYNVFYLPDPVRLVIDVQGTPRVDAAVTRPMEPTAVPSPVVIPAATPPPTPLATPTPSPSAPSLARVEPRPSTRPSAPPASPPTLASAPMPIPTPAATPTPAPSRAPLAQRRLPPVLAGAPRAAPSATPRAPVVVDSDLFDSPRPRPSASPSASASRAATERRPEAPAPPQPNRTGSISLARQLGLGARRIVVDAGHGGHDPGTIGHGGLQEKDLVLDVALRLTRLLRSELKAEVVMTRDSDVFIPLEERTGIANSKGADLFLSIHANSSPNRTARGIETYFLNFAKNARAQEVAARENAISAATLKDLQSLVKAITTNSKIDESRDFAALVQESLVAGMQAHDPKVLDRGVHTAPFYVLIGASMPSILAEIAFVSNPAEEKKLRNDEYRDRIAQSLLAGVTRYLEALNRTQLRQLTSTERPTRVVSRGRKR